MLAHTHGTQRFAGKVRQIRARVPAALARWGLRSKFARWRLAQDPSTGLVVLFGVLNKEYIAAHPTAPFNDYFDPRVLLDLSNDLTLPVVSSDSGDFWYAFILDRGQLGPLPAREDFSSLDAKEPIAGVWHPSGVVPASPIKTASGPYRARRRFVRRRRIPHGTGSSRS